MYGNAGYGRNSYGFQEFKGYSIPESRSYESSHSQGIERIVLSEPKVWSSNEAPAVMPYISTAYSGLYLKKQHIQSETFLVPDRAQTPIIQSETKIMPFIEEAFEKQTGEAFPQERISLTILEEEEFMKASKDKGAQWSPGLAGFALNRVGKGVSEIFVKKAHLDSMMLTIGHEIGHVMSPTLNDARDEEAKAIAFSMAWMQTIKKHNVAGIAHNINPNPARNGLHDVAYDFVLELMDKGKQALQVFKDIANGIHSITKKLEAITLEGS